MSNLLVCLVPSTAADQFRLGTKYFATTMSRDISIQWEPLHDAENTKRPNNNMTDLNLNEEVPRLKAHIWSLKSSLSDSLQCSHNLQLQLTNTVQEKYELLEEINSRHKLDKELLQELSYENEQLLIERRILLNEMYELRDELSNKQNLVTIMNIESRELKHSLYKAQDTIHKMGNMFLKLKSIKKCGGNVTQ